MELLKFIVTYFQRIKIRCYNILRAYGSFIHADLYQKYFWTYFKCNDIKVPEGTIYLVATTIHCEPRSLLFNAD